MEYKYNVCVCVQDEVKEETRLIGDKPIQTHRIFKATNCHKCSQYNQISFLC